MRFGVIGGSNLYNSYLLADAMRTPVATAYGSVDVYQSGNIAFIPRHGGRRTIPPHMINHRANLSALRDIGVRKVIGVCMTGSLKKAIKPPAILIPHDYVSLWSVPTFFDQRVEHVTPLLDQQLRKRIISAARKNRIPVREKGIYVQTIGPRLETQAEIRILKNYGDVVGMTMASEATLAQELGLGYAAVCTVDNYANGIVKKPLDFKRILEDAEAHAGNLLRLLKKSVEDSR
jgi:5'-methylthioadenosine phosphorylase